MVMEEKTGVRRATLRAWMQGKCLPQMPTLLEFCRCIQQSPLKLLTSQVTNNFINGSPSLQPVRRTLHRNQLRDGAAIHQRLVTIINSEIIPPPSMREVGRQLQLDPRYLLQSYREESQKISARFLDYKREQLEQKRQMIDEEVRRVTRQIHDEGAYPSREMVTKRITKPKHMWSPVAKTAWKETLNDLGYAVED